MNISVQACTPAVSKNLYMTSLCTNQMVQFPEYKSLVQVSFAHLTAIPLELHRERTREAVQSAEREREKV